MKSPSIDRLFRAFADENRLRILNLLAKGEICVCDLMSVLKMPQPKVSRHLAYLRRVGLVESRRDKYWIYYSLAKANSAFQKKLLGCLDCCLDEALVFHRDRKMLARTSRREACGQ